MTETQIQNDICQYLDSQNYFNATWIRDTKKKMLLNTELGRRIEWRGIFWRQNIAPVVIKNKTGKILGFKKMPKYAMSGVPDIIVVKNSCYIDCGIEQEEGEFIGIEVKKPGSKLSEWQKIFHKYCPGVSIIATSVEDVKAVL